MAKKEKAQRLQGLHAPLPTRQEDKTASTEDSASRDIVERPDGFYWLATEGLLEFGPYESYELARNASSTDEEDLAERETVIVDWIDPKTKDDGN
ncbi:hypothetical protein [Aquabacterium sp. CECT 9606]|uniref:hypothetical protein n=1 Tax=Aquabacterium sp. CECT 9606 TaxID=2845822 RepID=UPI001E3DC703|nr:hypothetical protein [Aquabacterium sp. CECT 9606]CAH0355873.1 hypothetical protein AQB9606_04467 [Aquabacterium sp. CECT 9606]